jgi:hypothetical protein
VLVASQVAGCCVLLMVAGLMIRGLQRLLSTDRGFDFYNVAILDPSLDRYGIRGEAARSWWENVRRAVASHPETESVAIVSNPPLGGGLITTSYADAPGIRITRIDAEPGFFALMKIPILAAWQELSEVDFKGVCQNYHRRGRRRAHAPACSHRPR